MCPRRIRQELSQDALCRISAGLCLTWVWSVQWLFQDQVKSRLAKELRSMEEAAAHGSGSTVYPFSWAETLTADLRRLGSTPDGATYLDHLRRLVTGGPSNLARRSAMTDFWAAAESMSGPAQSPKQPDLGCG